jgi:hypothetical protein
VFFTVIQPTTHAEVDMKRRRFWSTLGGLAVVLAFVLSCLPATSEAGQQKVTWTFATNPGPAANTWSFYPYPRFQKLLEKYGT